MIQPNPSTIPVEFEEFIWLAMAFFTHIHYEHRDHFSRRCVSTSSRSRANKANRPEGRKLKTEKSTTRKHKDDEKEVNHKPKTPPWFGQAPTCDGEGAPRAAQTKRGME